VIADTWSKGIRGAAEVEMARVVGGEEGGEGVGVDG